MSSSSRNSAPLVSAIIPTYNCSQYLSQAIDSALAQTYPLVEVVVVDDGSTDDTAAVVQRYGSRVRYVRQENAGTAAARNTGIRNSSGELIALLDHDDRWLPTKLEKQVPLFAHPSVGLVHTGGRVFDAESLKVTSEYLPEPDLGVHDLMEWCRVGCATTVLRRAAVEQVGLFDSALPGADDWDMWIRIAAAGFRVVGFREVLVEIREHPGNQGKRIDQLYHIIAQVINKHRNTHLGCELCRSAHRRACEKLAEDYYVKSSLAAAKALQDGRYGEALCFRAKGLTRNPHAALRVSRRLLQGRVSNAH